MVTSVRVIALPNAFGKAIVSRTIVRFIRIDEFYNLLKCNYTNL